MNDVDRLYKNWLSQKNMDEVMINELKNMTSEEKYDAFYKSIEFGTGGLRGIMGAGTNRINIHIIRKVTLGYANYLKRKNKENSVAISYDNRNNSKTYALEVAKVLAANGIKSYLFKELRPTPMLSYAVRYYKATAGIMITASHNPKEYNGYKVYNETGAQLTLEQASDVIKEIESIDNIFLVNTIENNLINYILEEVEESYLKEVEKIVINKTNNDTNLVYSPLHGTGSNVIPKLLERLNYKVIPYLPHMINDGNFTNTVSTNPEEAKTFDILIPFAKENNADIILVTDPDADRLGIAVRNNKGEYILLNGNQTASLTLYYILSEKKKNNTLLENGYVFTTNVTTNLIVDIAKSFNQNVKVTLTGFKFICEEVSKIEDKYPYVFGCEESYGSLIADFVRDKDAVQAVTMLAEISCFLKDKNHTILDYLEQIYKEYGYYHEYTNNITLKGESGALKIKEIMNYFRNHGLTILNERSNVYDDVLNGIHYKNNVETKLDLQSSNVLKFYFKNGWVVLRPSGTEPKIKIYYSFKGNDKYKLIDLVKKINDELIAILERI